MEKVVFEKLYSYLTINNFLSQNNSGFKKKRWNSKPGIELRSKYISGIRKPSLYCNYIFGHISFL